MTYVSEQLAAALTGIDLTEYPQAVTVDGHRISADSPRGLRIALGTALYEQWHAGLDRSRLDRSSTATRLPRRDVEFERQLISATPHADTLAPARLRAAVPTGAEAAAGAGAGAESGTGTGGAATEFTVELGGVTVRVPAAAVRSDDPRPADTSVTVELPAVRPALSPGFLLVDGPHGGPHEGESLRRLYLHVEDPTAAPAVWAALLRELAARSLRYRAKVLSRPWSYPRRDAVVLYLPRSHADELTALAAALRGLPGLGTQTSVFAHPLGPGIATADEPGDTRAGWRGRSFGQHRAAAVAEGVLRHAAAPDGPDGPAGSGGPALAASVARSLRDAATDPTDPSRNG
ncbi:T3SS effector HopA1 family protein [Kitasatospora sp. NPDC088160]|uniref:T3SS effector HopA1 family protein n=1 Tax=Kitasatospora sp. NPDC088160 TaxID=3364072 RepID=UPI00382C2EEE